MKTKYTLLHDIRLAGKHTKAGTVLTLDRENEADAKLLSELLASNRLAEVPAPAPAPVPAPAPAKP